METAARGRFLDRMFRSDYHWLVGRIRRFSAPMADPEDVASETFVQAVSLPDLLELRDARAMLTTLAKRLIWRLSRRRVMEEAYLADVAMNAVSVQPSHEAQMEALSVLAAIDEALEDCSAKARAAFVHWHIDQWSHAQIAAELGVSVSMVRKYLAQTLLACHAVLGDA